MANRKVLINRHSTKNQAPVASEMFHGEIAVSHPSDLSATTIWTLNNNTMVPFASCAMTMQMIDNAITAADVTYDVKAAEGDAHVEVVSGGDEKAKVFTVSSKDVMSEKEFKAYSARTAEAVEGLMNMLITAVTGEGVIEVEPETTGATGYNIKHKEAKKVALGFNKVATDDYGHVIDYSAVTADDINAVINVAELSAATKALSAGTQHDIEALSGNVVEYVKVVSGNIETVINELSAGTKQLSADTHNTIVKLSGDTEAAISKAIEDLGTVSTTTGKYFTAIGVNDGKLVMEEAYLPTLTSAKIGTGNVVSDIAVNGHEISFSTVSVATSEDINKLSAATIALSAGTVHDLEELSGATEAISGYAHDEIVALSAGTIQLSADTYAAINQLSGFAHGEIVELSAATESAFTAILGMDKDADAVAGQVVTTVSQEDGKVTETKANVKDLQLGGYSKDTTATGAIAATDTINTALSKLENIVAANEISNADGSIVVTEPTGTATTTDVKVNIKSGEKVIKLDGEGGGLYTNLNLVKITESLPATVKERYEFRDSDNNKIGESIDIAKDSHIVSITYNEVTQKLIYTYLDASGATQTAEVDMAHLILETEVENGIQSVNGKLSIKLDTTGDDTGDSKFLTVGENGLKLDGVTDAINAAVNGLNYADTAVAGQYVTEVDETNGVISVQRANVSDAVLNGYAKGEKPASTAIAATDDVKGAIAKLEHQIDDAKSAATTKVVEGTDAGNNMTIVPTTGDDSSVTYTVNLTDVASKAALDAEIAARKAVDGQTGQTYAANASTNYITGATSLNDADVKLDAALKAVSDKVNATKVTEGTSVENYVTLTLDTATTAGTTALTINDSALKTKIDEINSTITAETKARQDAIADLDSTAQTSGNGYFLTSVQLADGKITAATQNDKVNSASTAAHADAATQVDQKLTFADDANDVEYDGSEAKTITFGTACTSTGITNERSMSITNGVVDVEVIDCGEY